MGGRRHAPSISGQQLVWHLSLLVAWFINVAILVVAAAIFHPIFLAEGTVRS